MAEDVQVRIVECDTPSSLRVEWLAKSFDQQLDFLGVNVDFVVMAVVIDRDGHRRTLDAGEIRQNEASGALDFAIRNLGSVVARFRGQRLSLKLNPHHLTDLAFAELALLITRHELKTVLLACYTGSDWRYEIVRGASGAIMKLAELRKHQSISAQPGSGRYLSRGKRLSELAGSHPHAALTQLWRWLDGQFQPDVLLPAINNHVNGRYILIGSDAMTRSLVFRDVGPNVKFYDPNWRLRTRGLRLRDQPDYEYGCWVYSSYRDMMLADQPRLDDIDANIQRPRATDVRLCYSRLMLPLRDRFGGRYVLSASHVDSAIDLRVSTQQPTEDIIDEVIGRHAYEPKP